MKILLLGANGYLGARLFLDLKENFEMVGTFHKKQFFKEFVQLDVTSKERVLNIFNHYRPNVVIHTANYPSPRLAVGNKREFKRLNLESTSYIKDAADQVGAKVVFISSFASLNPGDVYGKFKLESEKIIEQTHSGFLILRPCLILGLSPNVENDRPFNRILKCLDHKTVPEFDTSWHFQPTYIGHISRVLITVLNRNIFNKTIHVICHAVATQYSVAKDILKPFGVKVKPVDKKINIPLIPRDKKELEELGLPTCSYKEMIIKIQSEINNRNKYVIK